MDDPGKALRSDLDGFALTLQSRVAAYQLALQIVKRARRAIDDLNRHNAEGLLELLRADLVSAQRLNISQIERYLQLVIDYVQAQMGTDALQSSPSSPRTKRNEYLVSKSTRRLLLRFFDPEPDSNVSLMEDPVGVHEAMQMLWHLRTGIPYGSFDGPSPTMVKFGRALRISKPDVWRRMVEACREQGVFEGKGRDPRQVAALFMAVPGNGDQ